MNLYVKRTFLSKFKHFDFFDKILNLNFLIKFLTLSDEYFKFLMCGFLF